jgi:hypothetical protein
MRQGGLRRRHIHIFTDNQAAIVRASCLSRGPGQETARDIHDLALALHTHATTITIHWVPGHTSIQGQPTNNNHRATKTWADVVKNGGINVQIVLGNSNLGQATPTKMWRERGERRGGAARRLGRKSGTEERAAGERGAMGRGKGGPEVLSRGGNKGGIMDKNGRGRVEERGEPGAVASVQTGHMDPMTRYGHKPADNGVADLTHL